MNSEKRKAKNRANTTAIVKAEKKNLADTAKLYERVREILDSARQRVARTVNAEMVQAYWLIGQAIVEEEQRGRARADYGAGLIESLAARLKAEGFKGFSHNNLWYMRQFYLTYPEKLHALRGELSWTHYRLLLKVESNAAREFYETEAVAGNWSTGELERQINSFFFERLAGSKEKRKMLKEERAAGDKYVPQDFIKDPYILEFLNLKENDTMVRYTLPENEKQIFAASYKLYLPSEEEIIAEIKREQEKLRILKSAE